jgi:hypothetical protein
MASIEVRKRTTRNEDGRILQSYDLEIEVINADGLAEEIFVFQHGVAPARDGVVTQPRDLFISIADPVDMEEYPPNTPDLENEIPFYRLKSVLLRFRSRVELGETWGYIAEDIQGLVDALNIDLVTPETEDITFS